jgi:hypothetical protein
MPQPIKRPKPVRKPEPVRPILQDVIEEIEKWVNSPGLQPPT